MAPPTSEPDEAAIIGRTIAGQYQIIRVLGRGGMGTVYLARDTALHRTVAVKVIRSDVADTDAARDRFQQEARLAARLEHPGIVPIYALGRDGSDFVLAMRYLACETLGSRLRRDHRLPPTLVRRILADLATTLAYAHGEGVVHRDLKPDNIFLDGPASDPRPIIADFGIATRPEADTGPGQRRIVAGTPAFMSPEQATGDYQIDGRSDLFSLGVLGHLMLAGELPYSGGSDRAVTAAVMSGARSAPAGAGGDVPRDLAAVLARCLALDPADRFPTAAALAEALAAVPIPTGNPTTGGGSGISPAPSARRTTTGPRTPPWRRLPTGDVRQAIRSLRKTPTTTLAAVACLALGIGAATATFTAVNAALLRPPPFTEPTRLVSVFRTTPNFQNGPFSIPNFQDLAAGTRTLSGLAALEADLAVVADGGGGFRGSLVRASATLFDLLGARAELGRLTAAGDGQLDAPAVVVLSHEAWRRRFGADPAVIGRAIRINGSPHDVIGVLPPRFQVANAGSVFRADAWIPHRVPSGSMPGRFNNHLMLVGRLASGVSVAEAGLEFDRLMAGLIDTHPELRGEGIRVAPMAAEAVRSVRQPLLLLLGAVGLVLLVASGNVASLLLARAATHRRELAIRAALGANRALLARRLLSESAVLVSGGAVLGLGLAWILVRIIGSMAETQLPQLGTLTIDGRVMAFSLLLAVAVTGLCGIVPATRASRADPFEAMRSGGRGGASRGQHRFLRGLAVAEIGLSVVLLVGSGLSLRGLLALVRQPVGFATDRLLVSEFLFPPGRHPEGESTARTLDPMLAAVRAVPGVEDAATISLVPFTDWGNNFNIRYEGGDRIDPTTLPLVESRAVSENLFATLGIPVLRGRIPATAELSPEAPRLVVVNAALVRRDFGGRDPIGARFHLSDSTFATIVAVVADVRNFGPFSPPRPEVTWFLRQIPSDRWRFPLVIRTAGAPGSLVAPVSEALRRFDPDAAIGTIRPFEDTIASSLGRPQFFASIFGMFAATALLLAAAGLYGVLSYVVSRESREIGIQLALGSTPGRMVRQVGLRGAGLVTAGLLVGAAVAWPVTRLMGGLLYGVSPLDGMTWALVLGTMSLAGLAAVLVPARRAAGIDPLVSIKEE